MADDTGTDSTTDGTTDEPGTDSTSTGTDAQKQDAPPEMKRALSKANKEAETLRLKLKEYEDRDKTNEQKLEERATAAEERATAAERAAADVTTQLARYQVAVDKGLPAELAARLQGSTPEELAADADNLLAIFGSATSATSFDGGARTPAGTGQSMNDLIRRQLSGGR